LDEYTGETEKNAIVNFILGTNKTIEDKHIKIFKNDPTAVLILETNEEHGMADQRALFFRLEKTKCRIPVVIKRSYQNLNKDQFQLYSATDVGALMIDGFGDGIFLNAEEIPLKFINDTSFGILQATRTRISKTDYISCPSCGRTLFDLQETTAKIRKRTNHLKGLKIGIMGCIVNGPGEMADADYGYVGTGPGKITLYKEKNVVKKNVPEVDAVEELVELIKSHGDWIDPNMNE
jgi:(E)-4-hydroxy-3-methylbut-2-enyl-diphosphate synthase